MLTKIYTRPVPLNTTIADAGKEILTKLLTRQTDIARIDYRQRHAPHLADSLTPSLMSISSGADSVEILLNYPATIRFLDLKKAASGKKKRYYTPIYNRPLFGHLYGKGYSLSNVINAALQREYQNYTENLKNVLTSIEL